MNSSLLAHLFPYFKGSQEDVATYSLQYILSSNKAVGSAFAALISYSLQQSVPAALQYKYQVVGEEQERPDMCCFDSRGNEVVICESKFYAALTSNQPNTYLHRLIKNGGAGLVFICPARRKKGLWHEIIALTNQEFPAIKALAPYCVAVDSGVRMCILSWSEVLTALETTGDANALSALPDIKQLQGYCDRMDDTDIIPFIENDFSVETAAKIRRYYRIVDDLFEAIAADRSLQVSTKGYRATPVRCGYNRYFEAAGFAVTLSFNTDKWSELNSPNTPFWLKIKARNWKPDKACVKAFSLVDTDHRDDDALALFAPCFVSSTEIIADMKRQFMEYISIYKNAAATN